MNQEGNLAISYCQLFWNSKATCIQQDAQLVEPQNENYLVWQEDDEWTPEELTQAASLLQANEARCRIHHALTIRSRVNDDNDVDGVDTDATIWNNFYSCHGVNFFKDRHYLETEFPQEFVRSYMQADRQPCLVEIGCGVGNALLPLLNEGFCNETDMLHLAGKRNSIPWKVIGLDLSATAIRLLKNDPRFQAAAHTNTTSPDASVSSRAQAYCCDIARNNIPAACVGVATVTTVLFCLSAIDPRCHKQAAQQIVATLAPGGVLVIRDYGRYDAAQLKLGQQRHKLLAPNFYQKHDGTKCYYFELNDLDRLFGQRDSNGAGLETLELKYHRRKCGNRATQATRRRVWVQARFRKPYNSS